MSNYDTAKLVRGVVSDRDLIPVLTHFHMYGLRLQGTNGKLTIDAPWDDLSIDAPINIPAEPFVRAFEAMSEPHLLLKEDCLFVTEGKMRVKIPLSQDEFPRCEEPTDWQPMDNSIRDVCRSIRMFVSEDASRPWACGVLYRDDFMYATNNVVVVRKKWSDPWHNEFTIPGFGIDQLAKIDKDIDLFHVRDSAVGFKTKGDTWMESARYNSPWPDVESLFAAQDWDDLPPLSGTELTIVDKLLPFVPDKRHPVIQFQGNKISTMEGKMEAAVDIDCGHAAFHAVPLREVLAQATHMRFDAYPKAVPFENRATGLQGIIAGVTI